MPGTAAKVRLTERQMEVLETIVAMRCSHEGAKTILGLRVILRSRTWATTFASYLKTLAPTDLRP